MLDGRVGEGVASLCVITLTAETLLSAPVHEGSAMTDQAASVRLELLVFSDDASVRQEVIDGVGRRPAKGLPLVTWTETATAEGVRMAIKDREKEGRPPFDALVLDAEAKKLGGMGLAHELFTELDERPAVVLLTARPQDDWLAAWAKAEVVVPRPLDPLSLQEGVAKALTARRGTVTPAG